MQTFELDDIRATRPAGDHRYPEFVRSPDFSVGLYELPAGGLDPRRPHAEDEVYGTVPGRRSTVPPINSVIDSASSAARPVSSCRKNTKAG